VECQGGPEPDGADLLDRLAVDAGRLRGLLDEVASVPNSRFGTSLARGLYVLASLPGGGRAVGLIRLAERLEMPAGTVHRYLQTLIVAGFAQRDEKTREYSLALGLVTTSCTWAEAK